MIPAALFALLAIARLGAIHAVVFGGFSPPALAQRMEACKPRAIMTASCGIEGAKGASSYQPLIESAVDKSSHKPPKIIVWQRDQLRWDPIKKEKGERNWQRLVKSAKNRGLKADAVPVKSSDGLYIIYTSGRCLRNLHTSRPVLDETFTIAQMLSIEGSCNYCSLYQFRTSTVTLGTLCHPLMELKLTIFSGTTGLPKGVLREAGGHAVGLNFSIKYTFGIHGPGDVMFCASDIGWVVGHSYILYAPLLAGATTILFEGKPVGTPNADTFWRIIEEYKVNTMFTAPTALRAIRRDDGDNDFFEERGKRGGLKTLRALFLAGERSEPSIVQMYQHLLEKHCAPGALVVDNWWSSESGSPISGLALTPAAGKDFSTTQRDQPPRMKPGSAGKPLPGFDVRIVDDEGTERKPGSLGNVVLGMPLAPSGTVHLLVSNGLANRG